MNEAADWSSISEHVPSLLAYARRLARNEADARDLVQDACVRALEALRRSPERPASLRGWLLVVLRNRWLNVVRARRAETHARAGLADDGVDNSLVDTRASYAQFERAWRQLPDGARAIAEQCLLEEEPYEVVSMRVGVARATVATSIHRTRLHLRGAMFGT